MSQLNTIHQKWIQCCLIRVKTRGQRQRLHRGSRLTSRSHFERESDELKGIMFKFVSNRCANISVTYPLCCFEAPRSIYLSSVVTRLVNVPFTSNRISNTENSMTRCPTIIILHLACVKKSYDPLTKEQVHYSNHVNSQSVETWMASSDSEVI